MRQPPRNAPSSAVKYLLDLFITLMAMAISCNLLFLWDYTFYTWGDLVLETGISGHDWIGFAGTGTDWFVSWKTQGSCQSPLAFQLSSRTSQTHHLNPFISHTESESYMYHTTVGPLFTCLVELPFFKGLVKSHPNCGGRKNKRKATSTGRRLNPNCTTIAFTALTFYEPPTSTLQAFLEN